MHKALDNLHNFSLPQHSFTTTTMTSKPLLSTISSFIFEFRTLELFLAAFIFISIHSIHKRTTLGLPSWPIIGMLPSLLLALRGNIYDWITNILNNQGGTFTFSGSWLTSLEAVITSDPRNLEHLLKTKFTNFPKGPYFRTAVQDLLGEGIFGADDDAWKRQRRTASLEFHSPSFRAMTTKSIYTLVHSRLLPVLESAYNDKTRVDLQDVLLRLTFDNVCIIAFGTDPGCLAPGLPEIPFACAFEDATEATIVRFITPTTVWKVCRFLDVGNERRLRKSLEDVNEFAYGVITNRRRELEKNVEERLDLLTIFMRLKDEEGKEYSEKFLRDICVNFILAGRDTSSVALAWFFWLLEKNKEVEVKIVDEINAILKERGGGENYEGNDIVFKPEEIKKMEYLQAALTEALRLYPSVPERWIKDGRFLSESAYKFTAFNGGPRLCLGKDFAYYQMKYVAASIIYRYHVKVVENHPVEPKLALTMYMKHGLKVVLEKRELQVLY